MNEQTTREDSSFNAHFAQVVDIMKQIAHLESDKHGFWAWMRLNQHDTEAAVIFKLSRIALIQSELSECLEGIRKGLPDDHLPERSMEAAELADAVIRIFDYCGGFGIPLGEVIVEKMQYNKNRPFMHGKKA